MKNFRLTIDKISKIRGGSCCYVYKGMTRNNFEDNYCIIKLFGENSISIDLIPIILNDYMSVRQSLIKHNIAIPQLFGFFTTNDVQINHRSLNIDMSFSLTQLSKITSAFCYIGIVEQYVGISIRDLLLDNTNSTHLELIEQAVNFIRDLPEGVPLDTNPGNITIHNEDSKMYFIDLIPPDPWKHRSNENIQKQMERIFPSIRPIWDDNEKIKRYTLTKYRIERFYYYLDRLKALPVRPSIR